MAKPAITLTSAVRNKFVKSAQSITSRGSDAPISGADRARIEKIADTLIACYVSRPSDSYHNLLHIHKVMLTLEELLTGGYASIRQLMNLRHDADVSYSLRCLVVAALYHDSVDSELSEEHNVVQAAENFDEDFEGMLIGQGSASIIRESILATVDHHPRDFGSLLHSAVFCDADLWVLSGDQTEYTDYRRRIEAEYAGKCSVSQYIEGRTALLKKFLMRPSIYSTFPVIIEREATARRNIRWEIESLANDGLLPKEGFDISRG